MDAGLAKSHTHTVQISKQLSAGLREETGNKCQMIDGHGRICTQVCVMAALCVFKQLMNALWLAEVRASFCPLLTTEL